MAPLNSNSRLASPRLDCDRVLSSLTIGTGGPNALRWQPAQPFNRTAMVSGFAADIIMTTICEHADLYLQSTPHQQPGCQQGPLFQRAIRQTSLSPLTHSLSRTCEIWTPAVECEFASNGAGQAFIHEEAKEEGAQTSWLLPVDPLSLMGT